MSNTKRINLALQGGGAHGAFTWGALDRILDDARIEIAAISGTSAGALNGAALKSGLLEGGRDGAREKLNWLWAEIGANDHPALAPWMTGYTPADISRALEFSPLYVSVDMMSRLASPYSYGPLYAHPLKRVVEQFSFDQICAEDGPDLHICATNVRTGRIKLFAGDEITTDAILASGCLPTVFQAVEITDPKTETIEAYWDGGYMGNPALFPLFEPHLPADILVININPLYRSEVPKSPQEIQNRINEISFNGSLLRELRAINLVKKLLKRGQIPAGAMKDVLVHMVADDPLMTQLSVATKMIPNAIVIQELKEAGHRAADRFLNTHFDAIGNQSTVDLDAMFH